MTPEVHARDFDDTLVRTGGWTMDHFENVVPIREAIAEAQALMKEGHHVHIVCGRHGETLRKLTIKQVKMYLGADFPENRIHTIRQHEEFQGNEFLASWKAQVLRDIKAKSFHGDTVTDLQAAEMAKVPFTWVGKLNG